MCFTKTEKLAKQIMQQMDSTGQNIFFVRMKPTPISSTSNPLVFCATSTVGTKGESGADKRKEKSRAWYISVAHGLTAGALTLMNS